MIIQKGTIIKSLDNQEIIIQNFIGPGGFGDVYYGIDETANEEYAIKFLRNPFDDKSLKTFYNEVKLSLDIDDKNVIKYYFFHNGLKYDNLPPYIVMEFADGGTLRNLINIHKEDNKTIPNEELLKLFSQLIAGMKTINGKLIHRDLKPENILLKDGLIKISDFGISKVVEEATRNSTFKGFGCLPYIAPEAWAFEKNTIKMDIYSMGIVFYELVCLTHPLKVKSNDQEEWKNAHIYQATNPPNSINNNISSVVDRTITKMMNKNETDRFSSWDEIMNHLAKDKITETPDDHFIENAIKKRTEQISQTQKKILEIEKKEKEKDDFKKRIAYQLENDIYLQLKEFVDKFNDKCDEDSKIDISFNSESISINITFSNRNSINIQVYPIFEEHFYRKRSMGDFGSHFDYTELSIPEYNHKKLMAWGIIKASDGKGMNILLVESEESLYGFWVTLVNKNSVIANRQRLPEPFAFEMDELERELKLIIAIHIYSTKHQVLDINNLKQFISDYY